MALTGERVVPVLRGRIKVEEVETHVWRDGSRLSREFRAYLFNLLREVAARAFSACGRIDSLVRMVLFRTASAPTVFSSTEPRAEGWRWSKLTSRKTGDLGVGGVTPGSGCWSDGRQRIQCNLVFRWARGPGSGLRVWEEKDSRSKVSKSEQGCNERDGVRAGERSCDQTLMDWSLPSREGRLAWEKSISWQHSPPSEQTFTDVP